jgi:hypothetical protein
MMVEVEGVGVLRRTEDEGQCVVSHGELHTAVVRVNFGREVVVQDQNSGPGKRSSDVVGGLRCVGSTFSAWEVANLGAILAKLRVGCRGAGQVAFEAYYEEICRTGWQCVSLRGFGIVGEAAKREHRGHSGLLHKSHAPSSNIHA